MICPEGMKGVSVGISAASDPTAPGAPAGQSTIASAVRAAARRSEEGTLISVKSTIVMITRRPSLMRILFVGGSYCYFIFVKFTE